MDCSSTCSYYHFCDMKYMLIPYYLVCTSTYYEIIKLLHLFLFLFVRIQAKDPPVLTFLPSDEKTVDNLENNTPK